MPIYQDISVPSTSQGCSIENLEGNTLLKVLYTEPVSTPSDTEADSESRNHLTNDENNGKVSFNYHYFYY